MNSAPTQPQASPNRNRARGQRAWWLLAGTLLVLGTGCFVLAAAQHGPALAPASAPVFAGKPPAPGGVISQRPAAPRTIPVRLTIPRIKVSSVIGSLGLNADGTVQVPRNPHDAGWYRGGPSPGQPGSAVILGHVDSDQGPAVFYLLSALRPGDTLRVRLADHRTAHFVVTAVATYLNADFPNREVYGPHGYPGLQLVTCGDGFNSQTQQYLGNVVVYTKLTTIGAPR